MMKRLLITTLLLGTVINCVAQGETLNFDGINDRIVRPQQSTIKNNFTFEAWVNPNATTTIQPQTINGVSGLSGANRYLVFPAHGQAYFGSNVYVGAGFTVGTNGICIFEHTSGYIPSHLSWSGNLTGWNHIAIVYSNKQPSLYVNGILVATGLLSISTDVYASNYAIGGDAYGWYIGNVDEVRIWSVARTQAQIQENMNCEIPTNSPSLFANYHFNQGIPFGNNYGNNQLFDASGNNNTGTLENFALNSSTSNWINLSGVVSNFSCKRTINLQVLIQGYYVGAGMMTPALMNEGLGTNSSIVDSVEVQLRNDTYPFNIVSSVNTHLSTNGIISCTIPTSSLSGNKYIVVKHRNSIETWSAMPVSINNSVISYNFTSFDSQAYGNNLKEVESGKWALFSGDINQDENTDLLDLSILEVDINNFQFGYFPSDINGDGNIDLLDSPLLESNINSFVFSNHP